MRVPAAAPVFTFPTPWQRLKRGAMLTGAVAAFLLALILTPAIPWLLLGSLITGGWSLAALVCLAASTVGAVAWMMGTEHLERRRVVPVAACALALCALAALPAGRALATAAWGDIEPAARFVPDRSCSDVSGHYHPCE